MSAAARASTRLRSDVARMKIRGFAEAELSVVYIFGGTEIQLTPTNTNEMGP